MKKLLITLLTTFTLNSNAAEIEIYQFWLNNFGYTCNTSKTIIEQVIVEEFPGTKYEIIDLNQQPSSSVAPNSYYSQKAVAILNKETGKYTTSQIRNLIGMQMPTEQIKQEFIKEVKKMMK